MDRVFVVFLVGFITLTGAFFFSFSIQKIGSVELRSEVEIYTDENVRCYIVHQRSISCVKK